MPEEPDESINLVHVVVAADGMPTHLAIRPEAMRLSPQRLAEVILRALRAAHADALRRMLARFEDVQVDPHTPSLRRARETAAEIQANVMRRADQVQADLDSLRRRLGDLTGG